MMHNRGYSAKRDLNLQVMGRLIEFAYTASISVGEKCVIHVMNGAVMYQIDSVVKACCDFLVQQLDPSNAIGIANFAEQIGCTELHQKAREYIYMNFSQVRKSQIFQLQWVSHMMRNSGVRKLYTAFIELLGIWIYCNIAVIAIKHLFIK